MEVEVTQIPPLSAGQISLVENHSLLNVFHVLRGEVLLLGTLLAGNSGLMRAAIERCDLLIETLGEQGGARAAAAHIVEHEQFLFEEIDRHIDRQLGQRADGNLLREVEESRGNLRSVFSVLQVRAREVLARAGASEAWERVSVRSLEEELRRVLAAIERNARHRFGIVYNLALQRAQDYYIDFKGEHPDGAGLVLPSVFKDVLRDLLANARKYTAPGGQIRAAIYSDDRGLKMIVQDTGRGIPPAELQEVAHFGRRASNALGVRTMGGGFGLTKAFLATKQFGGRFWIDSEIARGTSIRISLPRPRRFEWARPAALPELCEVGLS